MPLIEPGQAGAHQHPARVVFPDALDHRAIQAAAELQQRGWAKPVLLANPFALRDHCIAHGIDMPAVATLDPTLSPQLDSYAATLRAKRPELSEEAARKQLQDPLWYGAMMLVHGDADYCIAGTLSATASVLRAALRVIGLAEGINTLSSMFFMISADQSTVLGFGDCGVVPEPTSEQLADIAINTAENFQRVTEQLPRVAMLSFSTQGSAKHAAAVHVSQAAQLARARQPQLLLDGEMQFDAAFVPQVAAQKAPGSAVAGQANVFIFPSLAAGNIAYKITERLGGFKALGPMIQGLRLPMHDLSRGCSTADMVEVTLLAMKMNPLPAQRPSPAGHPLTRATGSPAKPLSVASSLAFQHTRR